VDERAGFDLGSPDPKERVAMPESTRARQGAGMVNVSAWEAVPARAFAQVGRSRRR
jgi:hypothetical protein